MNTLEITIIQNGKRQTAGLIRESKLPEISFCKSDGYKKIYQGSNYYTYLANIRIDHPDRDFL